MKYLSLSEKNTNLPLFRCCHLDGSPLRSYDLASGQFFENQGVCIKIDEGYPYYADLILVQPCMLPLVSQKLKEALFQKNYFSGQSVPVQDEFYANFSILNPIPLLDLINEDKSETMDVNGTKLYIRPYLNHYSAEEKIFRIKGYPVFPFLTEQVAIFLNNFDCKGASICDLGEMILTEN